MKKGIFMMMLLISSGAMAQSGFGVTGGLNYADNGEIEYTDVTRAGEDAIKGGESKAGYHVGLFYRAEISGIFLKPELLYSETKSSYKFNDSNADYKIQKIDLPIMLGLDIIGPINVFAGPSFQYILENDFEGVTLGDVENEFTVGAQFGVGVQFGGFGADVRYERGLSDNEAAVLDLNNPEGIQRVDARPSQVILSLSLNL
ncbi:MAG: outer membrane beta-barrel protein [Salinimicrobium sp.]